MRPAKWLVSSVALTIGALAFAGTPAASEVDDDLFGVYDAGRGQSVGIDRFITDGGDTAVLYSNYRTNVVRRIFPVSRDEWEMGPSFGERSPREMTIRPVRDGAGSITGLRFEPVNGAESRATKIPLRRQDVVIRSGSEKLAGTLLSPARKGTHPAIVLLHGSGPLTRYSFGPYPHFFASLGFAVLTFDKRGTGESTGTTLDASSGALQSPPDDYRYPDRLLEDALSAFRFLEAQPGVDPKRIGFWGSSEGGMLATQAAARQKSAAFAIDSSGFMGPLWETLHYQAGALARQRGASAAEAQEVLDFSALWMRVARTGEGYEEFLAARERARREGKQMLFNWRSGDYTSLGQMRWDWDHTLSFSPLPALRDIACPVLGIWGADDVLTDAPQAEKNMREALGDGKNVTTRIIPHASHSLMEVPGRRGMAPGVFDTLRTWLGDRIR